MLQPHYGSSRFIQHVDPHDLKPLHSWGRKKVQLLCSATMRKAIKEERKLDKQRKVEGGQCIYLFFLLPGGAERVFCSCSLTARLCRGSSCYYCTHCCGLIRPRATLSASQIVIAAAVVMRQPAVQAWLHL